MNAILDPQALGSFHVSGLTKALVNMMTGVFDRGRLEEALRKLDIDGDGKIHVDELRYFIEVYGTQM